MDAHRALLEDGSRALASAEAARFVPRLIGHSPPLSAWAAVAIDVDDSIEPARGREAREAPSKERKKAPLPQRDSDPFDGITYDEVTMEVHGSARFDPWPQTGGSA